MNWVAWYNQTLPEHVSLYNQYKAQGYGFISLSIYGFPSTGPYYAAVMIRPAPSQQHHYPNVLGNTQVQQTFNLEAPQGYGPVMIAATGPAAEPMFAVVFEPQYPIALTYWGLGSDSNGGTDNQPGSLLVIPPAFASSRASSTATSSTSLGLPLHPEPCSMLTHENPAEPTISSGSLFLTPPARATSSSRASSATSSTSLGLPQQQEPTSMPTIKNPPDSRR
jgi:hypothetical protein